MTIIVRSRDYINWRQIICISIECHVRIKFTY